MIEVKIPSPGESITEVEIASWLVENGDYVEKDQEIAEIESDKATLPLVAEESGTIEIIAEEGQDIGVGEVACKIDPSAEPSGVTGKKETSGEEASQTSKTGEKESAGTKKAASSQAGEKKETPEASQDGQKDSKTGKGTGQEQVAEEPAKEKAPSKASSAQKEGKEQVQQEESETKEEPHPGKATTGYDQVKTSPVAEKMMRAQNLSVEDVIRGLKRITREEVEMAMEGLQSGKKEGEQKQAEASPKKPGSREVERKKMSRLRRKLSERLVSVKNETAMLTTFNEVDMSGVMKMRNRYQKQFQEVHGVKLGLISFFIKASAQALEAFPNVNSMIEGDEVIYPQYADIGIAVQTPKGLMVPVIRNVESLSIGDIEKKVKELGQKGQNNRISIEEMEGGTFSITNGGVFGSLLSTPIINPPQSAILGMHNVQERPVAIDGKMEIRPMMYIALSYDHRTIDGKDSVSFLVKVKELIEDPRNMLLDGGNADKQLLNLE